MRTLTTLEGISDGKIYDYEDWVEADAGGCEGCSACCHHVGDLVGLTPFDVYEITQYLGEPFKALQDKHFALREEKKVLLPYLKMQGADEACSFLNEAGRCQIHSHRPNICRLFPLGRIYENDGFKYFLQVASCTKPKLEKVQVKNWVGIAHYEENKAFIFEWHQLIKALQFRLKFVRDEEALADFNNYLLETFYQLEVKPGENFYIAFARILPEAKSYLGII